MSTKKVKDGKISRNHTSLIEPAAKLINALISHEDIRRVTPGRIQAGIKRRAGGVRIKIKPMTSGLLLTIVGNRSAQEVRIYTNNTTEVTKLALQAAKKEGFKITASAQVNVPPKKSL